mgnify:CR=1 FL=1
MAKKNDEIIDNSTILHQTMEDVMHSSMIPYSEHVILERALPRVEDGLKPVQRRILYVMYEQGLTPDKPFKKSANIVGETMAKYHPHGDSSIYDTMVRMAQDFVMRAPLVDGHGNFGSIDGDSAAAFRYTEARMAPLALELLRDIEKDTVKWSLNFDDTRKEPDILPGRFPNLLVNGATGIAVGLATNIPTHNLAEVIDGVVAQIDNPRITLDEMLKYIKGPDFPTGGLIVNGEAIKDAYTNGSGKLTMRAKISVENGTNGKKLIVIHEVPYQVNKAAMLVEIMKMVNEKKGPLTAISDIRDESDREGLRAVIEVKKDGDIDKILTYLYKYSNLQKTFGVNMVAIADGKPKQMGLLEITKCYIEYQKEVERKRVRHDLESARQREEILSGLMIAIQNIDKVIKIIRSSPNVRTAKERLRETFDLTDRQATAILEMRLQRLTGLEIESLKKELNEVRALIAELESILNSKAKLNAVIKKNLLDIKRKFKSPRKTEIVYGHKEEEVTRDTFRTVEDVVLSVDRQSFIRRSFVKNYNLSSKDAPQTGNDALTLIMPAQTDMNVLFFTNSGNCYNVKVEDIPDYKWRDKGCAPGRLCSGFEENERIVFGFAYKAALPEGELVFMTEKGMIKISDLSEYAVKKNKFNAITLKDGDKVITVDIRKKDASILFITENAMSLNVDTSDVSTTGRVTAGVKGISLDENDRVVFASQVTDEGEIAVFTEKGYGKRTLAVDYELSMRARKGNKTFEWRKNGSNGSKIAGAVYVKEPVDILALHTNGETDVLNSETLFIEQRLSAGKPYILAVMGDEISDVCALLI